MSTTSEEHQSPTDFSHLHPRRSEQSAASLSLFTPTDDDNDAAVEEKNQPVPHEPDLGSPSLMSNASSDDDRHAFHIGKMDNAPVVSVAEAVYESDLDDSGADDTGSDMRVLESSVIGSEADTAYIRAALKVLNPLWGPVAGGDSQIFLSLLEYFDRLITEHGSRSSNPACSRACNMLRRISVATQRDATAYKVPNPTYVRAILQAASDLVDDRFNERHVDFDALVADLEENMKEVGDVALESPEPQTSTIMMEEDHAKQDEAPAGEVQQPIAVDKEAWKYAWGVFSLMAVFWLILELTLG